MPFGIEKKCIDALGAGVDGFNGQFYQKYWEILKDDVCWAVTNFFSTRKLPEQINETLVTLVPKVSIPECTNQLRPISCCNFLYKIIS